MNWCQTIIHTTTEAADIISDMLMRLGASGTEIVDRSDVPDPNKPGVYWELYDEKILHDMPEDVLVKGWFELNEQTHDMLQTIKQQLLQWKKEDFGIDMGTLHMALSEVEDADWAENWKKYYKPFRVGSRLVIKPTWESYNPQPGDLLIELNPGMAFGTGTHETTNMCLELLEKHLKSSLRVMDVGTGSGILAIAAAKLGAAQVLAIDIDPDAVKVAQENVTLNHTENQVRVICGDLVNGETMSCDLAVANIVADAICMLAKPLTRHLQKEGLLLCSGIIREREADVLSAAKDAGYTVYDRLEKGEWVALCLKAGA